MSTRKGTGALSRYIGRTVTVNYIDDGRRNSIDGKLIEVVPGSNIVVGYNEGVPEELRRLPIFDGARTMKTIKGIPFSGSSAWILSILSDNGQRIYLRHSPRK